MASVVAAACDRVAPLVIERLSVPLAAEIRVEVRATRFLDDDNTFGQVIVGPPARIVLGAACLEDRNRMEMGLAHELAHLHMRGPRWDRLPYVLEEGIAQVIELEFRGNMQIDPSLERIDPSQSTWMFALTLQEARELPEDEYAFLYRAARGVVERIGLSRLLAMVEADRLSVEDILDALDRQEAVQATGG
ncbi:MAG: hypothetical protein EXS08_03855 [Planctomycetes bacterium]|nr:hypothetical protein [Planctomycetota bacterium]